MANQNVAHDAVLIVGMQVPQEERDTFSKSLSQGSLSRLRLRSARAQRDEEHRRAFVLLEILHVAAALTLGARVFVSFDDRQRKLARRARLKVLPRIRSSAVQPDRKAHV